MSWWDHFYHMRQRKTEIRIPLQKLFSKVKFLFQETEVEAEVDREAEDEAKNMVVREMSEKSMNMKVGASPKASTIIKNMKNKM